MIHHCVLGPQFTASGVRGERTKDEMYHHIKDMELQKDYTCRPTLPLKKREIKLFPLSITHIWYFCASAHARTRARTHTHTHTHECMHEPSQSYNSSKSKEGKHTESYQSVPDHTAVRRTTHCVVCYKESKTYAPNKRAE